MKFSSYLLILFPFLVFAQAPPVIKYQATAYDLTGEILSNQEISVKMSIVKDDSSESIQWLEIHTTTTTTEGLFTLSIGAGEKIKSNVEALIDINWLSATYFLKIELDIEQDGSYVDFETQQFISVPYSLYLENPASPISVGSQGVKGTQGVKGFQGEQGVKGSQGEQGIQGSQGEQGIQGSQGEQGIKGETGNQGSRGEQGVIGLQGEQGIKGEVGKEGSQGERGSQGKQGTQGEQGIQGESGDSGIQGERGIQGDIGLQGKEGEQGIQGKPGGLGIQGERGFQGDIGLQGKKGEQGIQGESGDLGIQGEHGLQGDIGLQGKEGERGERGLQGKDGGLGGQGEQGVKGKKGDEGIQGQTGERGSKGEKGNKGDIGIIPSYVDSLLNSLQDQITYIDSLSKSFESRLELMGKPLQESLDKGYSIKELSASGFKDEHFIGKEYKGGRIFYINSSKSYGLVCAVEDSKQIEWGCVKEDVVGAYNSNLGAGYNNTLTVIEAKCTEMLSAAIYASEYEFDDYTDWYLPSIDELALIFNSLGAKSNSVNLSGFSSSDDYWSSTQTTQENSKNKVSRFSNINKSVSLSEKNATALVKPIRSFGNWVFGCMDLKACTYKPSATMVDNSCEYPNRGYDCDGNITEPYIGMKAYGGIIFNIDESGKHGLFTTLKDIDYLDWTSAGPLCEAYVEGDYESWRLPNLVELKDMYNTIGYGSDEGNLGGFINSSYWSSESSKSGDCKQSLGFSINTGYINCETENPNLYIRPIHAF